MPDEKKPILDPERELPAPHDMGLKAGYGAELPSGTTNGKKRSFPLWIFPIIALLIVLLAGGMYLLNMQKTEQKMVPPTEPTMTPSPTPTPDPTANWKTFVPKTQAFSFEYPPELSDYITESKNGIIIAYPGPSDVSLLSINIFQTTLDPQEWWVKQGKRNYSWLINTSFNTIAISRPNDKKYDELKGVEVIGQRKILGGATLSASIKLFPHNNSIYVINDNTQDYKSDVDATMILSTFKFLDQTASPSPSISQMMKACTMDAKICPDGSTVGRTGPNCEFKACPE